MVYCSSNDDIFHEAINHSRHKKKIRNFIYGKIHIEKYENNIFEDIFSKIYDISKNIAQVGDLARYDITSAICRHYDIIINKVYIIGGGPYKAIKRLNIKKKIHKINNDIKLHFVTIDELINAFDNNKYTLPKAIRQSIDGDIWESFICNWGKKQRFK